MGKKKRRKVGVPPSHGTIGHQIDIWYHCMANQMQARGRTTMQGARGRTKTIPCPNLGYEVHPWLSSVYKKPLCASQTIDRMDRRPGKLTGVTTCQIGRSRN